MLYSVNIALAILDVALNFWLSIEDLLTFIYLLADGRDFVCVGLVFRVAYISVVWKITYIVYTRSNKSIYFHLRTNSLLPNVHFFVLDILDNSIVAYVCYSEV